MYPFQCIIVYLIIYYCYYFFFSWCNIYLQFLDYSDVIFHFSPHPILWQVGWTVQSGCQKVRLTSHPGLHLETRCHPPESSASASCARAGEYRLIKCASSSFSEISVSNFRAKKCHFPATIGIDFTGQSSELASTAFLIYIYIINKSLKLKSDSTWTIYFSNINRFSLEDKSVRFKQPTLKCSFIDPVPWSVS